MSNLKLIIMKTRDEKTAPEAVSLPEGSPEIDLLAAKQMMADAKKALEAAKAKMAEAKSTAPKAKSWVEVIVEVMKGHENSTISLSEIVKESNEVYGDQDGGRSHSDIDRATEWTMNVVRVLLALKRMEKISAKEYKIITL